MAVTRFEDLVVWQKAKGLCVDIYRVTGQGPFARDYGLRDQIQRAAVSVMSNIAEGFERKSRAEFAHVLSISRGSVGEVRSQLYLARDLRYLDETEFTRLLSIAGEIRAMIIALRRSLGS